MVKRLPNQVRWLAALVLVAGFIVWVGERRAQERRLFEAAAAGDLKMVRALVDRGLSVNARDRKGGYANARTGAMRNKRRRTPLHYAAESGNGSLIRYLISAGADVNARAADHHTPLMLAVEWQGAEEVRALVAAGADVNAHEARYGETALHLAAGRGDLQILQALLKSGARVNATSESGHTALSFAARQGHPAALRLLLEHGAAVHLRTQGSPLYDAALEGHLEIARILVAHGADAREKLGDWTPAAIAAQQGHPELSRYLGTIVVRQRQWKPVPIERRPAKWSGSHQEDYDWSERLEHLALVAGLPIAGFALNLWLLRRMWRSDGLTWLKPAEQYLPLRGRWLRTLLTAGLVLLALPLCAYHCVLLFGLYLWLVNLPNR